MIKLYAATIFLSAFLLFQVQPILGKYILPWFGGGASVWTTCLLFFQTLLLAGYTYAHFIGKHPKRALIHFGLLIASLLFLPIAPNEDIWKVATTSYAAGRILLLLLVTIGIPYLLLSSTGPLMQKWFHISYNKTPYRLFAVSNGGSLIALVSYPFFIEPYVGRHAQVWIWSGAFVLFVICAGMLAWQMKEQAKSRFDKEQEQESTLGEAAAKVPKSKLFMWLGLTSTASALLLATNNFLTQDVASLPFLWILPLSLYLLSFIISFDNEKWYHRGFWGLVLAVSVPLAVYGMTKGTRLYLWEQVAYYCAALFACCMVCHGELSRSKPDPKHLTFFYLIVSLGGAIGGIFVAVIAPFIYTSGYWEFHTIMGVSVALVVVSWFTNLRHRMPIRSYFWLWIPLMISPLVLSYFLYDHVKAFKSDVIDTSRNFYSALRIRERGKNTVYWRMDILSGNIVHGTQLKTPSLKSKPVGYYAKESGIGLAITHHPRRDEGLKIGVVGLGAGTTAALAKKGDYIRFYEINPAVETFARQYFSFLDDTEAEVDMQIGDARINMEDALERGEKEFFDVLAIDAFTGDSIPIHLLTKECIEIYRKLLKPDGILALHISNRYINLRPISWALQDQDTKVMLVGTRRNNRYFIQTANWMLIVNRGNEFLDAPEVQKYLASRKSKKIVHWTDDYASIWPLLK